jgi:hypothetical protein
VFVAYLTISLFVVSCTSSDLKGSRLYQVGDSLGISECFKINLFNQAHGRPFALQPSLHLIARLHIWTGHFALHGAPALVITNPSRDSKCFCLFVRIFSKVHSLHLTLYFKPEPTWNGQDGTGHEELSSLRRNSH